MKQEVHTSVKNATDAGAGRNSGQKNELPASNNGNKQQMKSLKYIFLTALLAFACYGAVFYASCSKDACRTVACLYGGSCGGGVCSCPDGTGGARCEVVYRTLYANTYIGNAAHSSSVIDSTYVPYIDTNATIVFQGGNDSSFSNMTLVWYKKGSTKPVSMNITLSNNSASGSDFKISKTTVDTFDYTGSGSVNANSASVSITESHPNSHSVIISMNNFTRQ